MDQILCFLIYVIVALSQLAKPLAWLAKPFSCLGKLFSKHLPAIYDEWKPGEPRKLLLVGYNGAMKGYFDEDVELLTYSSLFPLDILRACSAHHAAILCEGSTLKSTFANALTLMQCEVCGIMAAQHKPCIAYGAEVSAMEPFLERAARRLCRHTYFIARSKDSFEALKRLGLKGHAGTDAAWFYDGAVSPAEAERLLKSQGWDGKSPLLKSQRWDGKTPFLKSQGWDGKKPLLGIAVIDPFCWPVRPSLLRWLRGTLRKAVSGQHDRGGSLSGQYDRWYFFSDSPGRRKAFRRYLREVAVGVNQFLEKHDFYPVVIGMERLDAEACRRLRAQLICPGAMFLSGEHSAGEMTGVLRSLSALVTSRYHAAVLSMETGCPIIAVSMDERLDGLMKEIFTDEEFLFRTTEKNLGSKICNALEEARTRKEEVRKMILSQVRRDRDEIARMGDFLHKYLAFRS